MIARCPKCNAPIEANQLLYEDLYYEFYYNPETKEITIGEQVQYDQFLEIPFERKCFGCEEEYQSAYMLICKYRNVTFEYLTNGKQTILPWNHIVPNDTLTMLFRTR